MSTNPIWCINKGMLFKVAEVHETKKAYILRLEGLRETKMVRKKDKLLGFNERKPKGW